jgi:quercetin dioxygenase-like cupin family protein
VLEGELTVYVGEKRLSLAPGSFAFGPKGLPHIFIGETDEAKVLIGFLPFHFEGFLHEVGERRRSGSCRRR